MDENQDFSLTKTTSNNDDFTTESTKPISQKKPSQMAGLGTLIKDNEQEQKKIKSEAGKTYAFYLNQNLSDDTIQIQLELPFGFTIRDSIQYGLKELNIKLEEMKITSKLLQDPRKWNLFLAKQNGKPKDDYPPLDQDTKICQIGNLTFSLAQMDDDGIIVPQVIQGKSSENNEVDGRSKSSSDLAQQNYSNSLPPPPNQNNKKSDNQEKKCFFCF